MKQLIKLAANGTMVLVILLISNQVIQAQQRGQQGPPPLPNDEQIEQMVESLSEELSLTNDQEKQVSEKYFAHFETIEKKMTAGRPDHDEMEAMETDFEEEVKSLLTKSQQDLYSSYLKEQKQNRSQKRRK